MNKSESIYTLEETHASQSSLLSGSTNFSDNLLSENSSPSPNQEQPVTVKARFRFASAFSLKSLRRSKKNPKKSIETSKPTASSIVVQNLEGASAAKNVINLSPKPEKRKFRESLVKKLSLGSMKRNKKSAELKNSSCDKKNITPKSLKRHTPEGANLSRSEVSLVDIDYDETIDSEALKSKLPIVEPPSKSPLHKTTKPLILQREDQLQIITITGKRDRKEIDFQEPLTAERASTAEPHKPDRKTNRKINITESTDDALPRSPAPAVPYNISEVEISKILIATGGAVGHLTKHPTPVCNSKGAIKKTITTTTQHKTRRDYFEAPSMSKSNSLERGRRYPRPIDELLEMATDDSTPGSMGNNLSNTNLSGSITDIPVDGVDKVEEPNFDASAVAACKPKIEFELGTKVRPPTHIRPSTLSSQTSLSSSSSSSTQTRLTKPPQSMSVHFSRNDSVDNPETILSHESSLDLSSKSSESPEPRSEGSTARRRIAYMAIQSGSLSDDEENGIDSQPVSMVREPMSHLSGISEYSLGSDFSTVGYGDSMMDEAITMSSSTQEKREHLYKILVIGELGTGKTSFIKRYVHQFFSQNYRATIGVDFALKVLNWDQNTIIRLQLWDIAGQERFGNMTRVYYKEAVGAFIVFDVTRSATFDAVVKWKQDLDSKVQLPNGSPIPCILLANKCDQPKQGIVNTSQKMDEYVRENGFAGWFETSAKENVNIEEAARALVNKILLNDKLINSDDLVDADKFGLESSQSSKKNCAC